MINKDGGLQRCAERALLDSGERPWGLAWFALAAALGTDEIFRTQDVLSHAEVMSAFDRAIALLGRASQGAADD